MESVMLGVNISERQLKDADFSDEIKGYLSAAGLDSESLQFELSERKTINTIASSANALDGLVALGCRVVIDDFGSSFATTRYLNRFPFHHVKLHKSLVQDVDRDDAAAALSSATIAMVKTMNLPVTAVGIENAKQLELLIAQGCDAIQGYFLGKPQPASEMESLLKQYLSSHDVSDIG
jgi:EAL domain-containing protein (putative c-di-GMP-specific phosphodiesterase class I)